MEHTNEIILQNFKNTYVQIERTDFSNKCKFTADYTPMRLYLNIRIFLDNLQPQRTPPSEENINQLVEMGFNRNSVLNALNSTNNDISLATNVLLQES